MNIMYPNRSVDSTQSRSSRSGNFFLLRWIIGLSLLLIVPDAAGQYYVSQQGRLLDANPRLGSFGLNSSARLDSLVPRANMYVTGNVSGGARFQGAVPYRSGLEFQGDLGTSSLSSFRRDSTGINDLSRPIGGVSPYFDDSRSVTTFRAGRVVNSQGIYGTRITPVGSMLRADQYYQDSLSSRPLSQHRSLGGQSNIPQFQMTPSSPGSTPLQPWTIGSTASGPEDSTTPYAGRGLPQTDRDRFGPNRGRDRSAVLSGSYALSDPALIRSRLGQDNLTTGQPSLPLTSLQGRDADPSSTSDPSYGNTPPTQPGEFPEGYPQGQPGTLPAQQTEAPAYRIPPLEVQPTEPMNESDSPSDESASPAVEAWEAADSIEHTISPRPILSGASRTAPLSGNTIVDYVPSYTYTRSSQPAASSSAPSLPPARSDSSLAARVDQAYREHRDFYIKRGDELMRQNLYYQAANAYGSAVLYDPENPRIHLARSQALLGAGEFMSAAYYLSLALQNRPPSLTSPHDFERIFPDRKKFQVIMAELDLWQKRSGQPMLLFLKGYALYLAGETRQAQETLLKVNQLKPNTPAVKVLLDVVRNESEK